MKFNRFFCNDFLHKINTKTKEQKQLNIKKIKLVT